MAKLRDGAIIGALLYAGASVGAVIALRVEDYYFVGGRQWLRVKEDGAERHKLVDAKLEYLIDEYLRASGIENEWTTPLFRSTLSGNGKISSRAIPRYHV